MRRRWAYFWTQDFPCPPAEISRLLELVPSGTWVAGETVLSHGRVARTNEWRLESALGEDSPLDAHIEDVLGKIAPRLSILRGRIHPLAIGINCVSYFAEYQGNGFHLSADLLARLAAQQLSFDFDLYGNPDS